MQIRFKKYVHHATDKTSLIRAIKVTLIVGVILNFINNPEIFIDFQQSEFHIGRIMLTFIVPFCVSLYSSVLAYRKIEQGKIH